MCVHVRPVCRFLYPLFNPLHDLRELIESRLEHLCTSEAEHARSSNLPPGFQPQLNPEDGYRMDQVKSDFKGFYGYELENVRLGESARIVIHTYRCVNMWQSVLARILPC